MKRFSAQFKKQSESIRLRSSEHDALRARVLSYMEYHPLPTEMAQKSTKHVATENIISEPFKVFKFNTLYVRSLTSLFAVFLIVGIPVIAEKALPGDVLYPVKVQFNEQLRSTLTFTPYAKVAWETQRLERRIAEAQLLASEGKLTDEAQTAFAEAVKTHTDAAQREIEELRTSDKDEAAIAEITFASALAVQSEVLTGRIEKDPQQDRNTFDGTSVLALAEVVAQARTTAEAAQTNAMPSYEKLFGRVELESTHAYELFASVKESASSDEVVDIERTLADIQRKVTQAAALKAGTAADEHMQADSTTRSNAEQNMTEEAATSSLTDASASSTVATSSDATSTVVSIAKVQEIASVTKSTSTSTSTAEENNIQAVILLRSALADIQKLLNYLTHIDVRENVSISDLVPVVLTPEEREENIKSTYNEVMALKDTISKKEVPSRIRAKVAYGQKEIDAKLLITSQALEKGNLSTAEISVQDAYALVLDLTKLTNPDSTKIESPIVTATTSTTTEVQATSTAKVSE